MSGSAETLGDHRFGLDSIVDRGANFSLNEIKRVSSEVLPNRIHSDVGAENEIITGLIRSNLVFLDKNAEQKRVSQNIFNGSLAWVQGLQEIQFLSIINKFLIAIVFLACIAYFFSSKIITFIALIIIAVLSVFLSIRLAEGWDEFFINLRHAFMLVHHGVYSINSSNLIEATVDLFPLLFTALIGKAGFDLVNAFLLTSLIGNALVIVISSLIIFHLTKDRLWTLFGALVIGLYPNVIWVGGTGFTAVLFCGWILAGSYFYVLINKRYTGLFFLATLTLIRTEGILFSFILLFFLAIFDLSFKNKNYFQVSKKYFLDGLIISLPFILSAFFRRIYFGYFVPVPMLFKNTNFDKSYVASGIDKFSQMISSHDIHLMAILLLLLVIGNCVVRGLKRLGPLPDTWKKLLLLNFVAFFFILPYYMGGGDWFSYRWNRYGLPFNLIFSLTILVYLYGLFSSLLNGWKKLLSLYIFTIAISLGYIASAKAQKSNFILSTASDLVSPSQARWGRVDSLAELGYFLDKYLPIDAVVASPEEATIMYFSQREMIGLLGVSNPIVANMPLQPLSPGDILHRKRAVDAVYTSLPDVIALWEPVLKKNFEANEGLRENIGRALQAEVFDGSKVDISYYRIGSYKSLEDLGYHHLTVVLSNSLYSLFVSERIYNEIINKLTGDGFVELGTFDIKYSVSPWLSKKYASSGHKVKLK